MLQNEPKNRGELEPWSESEWSEQRVEPTLSMRILSPSPGLLWTAAALPPLSSSSWRCRCLCSRSRDSSWYWLFLSASSSFWRKKKNRRKFVLIICWIILKSKCRFASNVGFYLLKLCRNATFDWIHLNSWNTTTAPLTWLTHIMHPYRLWGLQHFFLHCGDIKPLPAGLNSHHAKLCTCLAQILTKCHQPLSGGGGGASSLHPSISLPLQLLQGASSSAVTPGEAGVFQVQLDK